MGSDRLGRAMAYLGAGVLLFERCDSELASVLLAAVERQTAKRSRGSVTQSVMQ